jgi:hypothetical protein
MNYEKTRQHNSSKSQQFHKDGLYSEVDEISNRIQKKVIGVINKIKKGTNTSMN